MRGKLDAVPRPDALTATVSARTARDVVNAIKLAVFQCHPSQYWLVLDEFPLDAGKRKAGAPRIDMLAIKTANGERCELLTRIGYEIKINRRDFLDELRNPEKRRKAYEICDEYWFAVPAGLVEPEELPPECGLLTIGSGVSCPCQMKSAEPLHPAPPSPAFMADMARRAYQVGQRDGAGTCAFERFDMLMDLAHMFIQNKTTAANRRAAVLKMATAIREMRRHPEARALAEIAAGGEPTNVWFVQRRLQRGKGILEPEDARDQINPRLRSKVLNPS